MNTRRLTRTTVNIWLIASAILALLLSACQPAITSTSLPTVQPTATQTLATQTPAKPSSDITLNLAGVAQDQTIETIAAVPASAGGPAWEAAPQHRRVTLQGYPVTNHSKKAQIFIYPAGELASTNANAGKAVADLQALLQTRQTMEALPYLPVIVSAKQVMDVQVQYLDVKNGKGVRYLTQLNNGLVPINNYQLVYTFQGLTSDGKYYIAAVLPVTHPELPATDQASAQAGAEYLANLTKTATRLDQQPGGSFTPDLAKLDALIQSIVVK